MSESKGMTRKVPQASAQRRNIWRSMRILRRFNIPDLCRTTGAIRSNVCDFVKRLERHGYIVQHGPYTGGQAGVYRMLRLVKDCGPLYPTRCDVCGQPLGSPCRREDENA